MKRDLKFRAYDSKNEHMFYHDEEGNFYRCIEGGRVGSDFSVTDLLFSPFDCLTAMQYTGLKDKNGVEIYEGDILENIYNDILIVDNYNEFIYNVLYSEDHSGLNNYTRRDIEIIGNIYKNNGLLKKNEQ